MAVSCPNLLIMRVCGMSQHGPKEALEEWQ